MHQINEPINISQKRENQNTQKSLPNVIFAYIFSAILYRWVDRFILLSFKKNTKKLALQSKYIYIKNLQVLFPMWSLKKKDILKLIK